MAEKHTVRRVGDDLYEIQFPNREIYYAARTDTGGIWCLTNEKNSRTIANATLLGRQIINAVEQHLHPTE